MEKTLKRNGSLHFRINGKETFGFTELNDKFIDRWLFALLQILHVAGRFKIALFELVHTCCFRHEMKKDVATKTQIWIHKYHSFCNRIA